MGAFEQVFSYVCGQEHNWDLGGTLLPFCQRCTGLYVGAALAVLLVAWFRPRPTPRVLWLHGLCLLLMVPFGYHWLPQNGELRMLTGQIFALGLVYCLALNTAAQLPLWRESRQQNLRAYVLASLLAVALLQLAVYSGGPATATALGWLGLVGLIALAVLAVANLLVLPATAWQLWRRRADSAT